MTNSATDVTMEDVTSQNIDHAANAVADPVQQQSNTASCAFDQFVDLIRNKLPQELRDQIQAEVMEMLFCPGYMFPWKNDGTVGRKNDDNFVWKDNGTVIWAGTTYNASRPSHLTLSKTIRDKYEKRMQTENMYAIGIQNLLPPGKERFLIRKALRTQRARIQRARTQTARTPRPRSPTLEVSSQNESRGMWWSPVSAPGATGAETPKTSLG
ncbi:MAG: hypothetical protein Q9221_003474 [Calogaya cf. arnoldii]